MDLSDLMIFSAVVREGSVTRAAVRLHRVQSNVTTRIRQLETDLSVALFIREGKRLHLAPARQGLLGYSQRLAGLGGEGVEEQTPRAAPRGNPGIAHRQSAGAGRGDLGGRTRRGPRRRADRRH